MRFYHVQFAPRVTADLVAVVTSVAAGLLLVATPHAAQAQANARVAFNAAVRVGYTNGITVSGNVGASPITSLIQQGTGLANINYSNGVNPSANPAGITTAVDISPATGNGPTFNRAQTTLLFTGNLTLTNTTSSLLSYTYQYDVTGFNTSVSATPNVGTALSMESVSIALTGTTAGVAVPLSNFSQSLSRTNGSATDNNGPTSVSGTLLLAANTSTTLTLRTNINIDTQYNPAAAAPEPGTMPLLGTGLMTGLGMIGTMKQRKAKKQAALAKLL